MLALKAHQIAAVADRLEALYDDGTVVVPVQNGVPWWFFQKLPGPVRGPSARSRSTRTAPSSATSRRTGSSACIAYPAAEREAARPSSA